MIEKKDFVFNIDNKAIYPDAPFHPTRDYPEFIGLVEDFNTDNSVYANVRSLFINCGFDKENI